MKKTVYILAVVLLLLVFGISAFMVGSYIIEGKQQEERFNELAAMKENARPTVETKDPQDPEEPTKETLPEGTFGAEDIRDENGILLEYSEIYALNNDLVGWIRIDGTKLNYPVMQTPDNPNYYLYRDFDKRDSSRGSIYVREECDLLEPSDNITIYGHNMRDGSMFEALNDYIHKDTWENNSLIFFDTLHDYHVYQIFAVFKTSANLGEGFRYHHMIDAGNKQEFDEFVKTCKDLSFYDTGITPQYGDKLICLSTCEYTLNNGRLVVAAMRIS